MTVAENIKETSAARSRYIPARYVYAAVSILGTFLIIVLRASFPITITAMVRRNMNSTASENVTDPDTCPFKAVHDNSSSVDVTKGDFDWEEVTQSYMLTAGGYGMLVTAMVGPRVAELWSAKYTFTICTFVGAVVFLLVPVTAQWSAVALIVFQVIGGLFLGPMLPISSALSAAWFPPEERQQLGGITLSAVNMGAIMSSVLTGNLVDNLGWQSVFYIFSSLVIVWLVLWMFFVFDSPDKHPRISEEERIYITESTKKDETQAAARLPWKEILLSPPVWAHIIMGLPSAWLGLTLVNTLPTYLTNVLHYSTTKASYFSAIPSVSAWFSMVFFGFLSQWIRRKQYLSHIVTYHTFNGICTLGTAAVVICLPLVQCDEVATISLLSLATLTSNAYIGGSQLNFMDLAINYSGTLSGWSFMVVSLASVLGPTVSGVITNRQQTLTAWNKVFYVIAAVNVVPFFVFLLFGSVEEQPWNRVKQGEADESGAVTVDVDEQSVDKIANNDYTRTIVS